MTKSGDLGRGGRLMIAVNDLIDATQLARSTSASDRELAMTMSDNAFRHVGRVMATVAPSHPFTAGWQDLMRDYGQKRGSDAVDYLHAKGLLADAQAAQLKAQAADLYVEAFASKKALPTWTGVQAMERAARTMDALQDAAGSGGHAERVTQAAVADMQKLIGQASEYIDDPAHRKNEWHVARHSNSTLTRAQAVAASLADPHTRAQNLTIGQSGVVERHGNIVAQYATPLANPPVMAISDRRWLDQIANYQQYISRDTTGVIANHTRDFGILLSPDSATAVVNAARTGTLDEVLLHEKFHTTQVKAPRPLSYHDDLHREWENNIWMEGATQAQTQQAMSDHQAGWSADQTRIHGYEMITAIVDEVADQSGRDRMEFLTGLSSRCQGNQRTAYVAQAFLGDDSVAAQQRLLAVLDPVAYEWETSADTASQDPRFVAQLKNAVSVLAQRVPVAA
jgi:hypothetical protein